MQTWAIKHPELTVGLELPVHEATDGVRLDQARRWDERIDQLLAIRQLEDDWDGQGTPAPTVEVVDSALVLALLLRREGVEVPTGVVQGVNGDVLFDWQSPEGKYVEVEVNGPYSADVFIPREDRVGARPRGPTRTEHHGGEGQPTVVEGTATETRGAGREEPDPAG